MRLKANLSRAEVADHVVWYPEEVQHVTACILATTYITVTSLTEQLYKCLQNTPEQQHDIWLNAFRAHSSRGFHTLYK